MRTSRVHINERNPCGGLGEGYRCCYGGRYFSNSLLTVQNQFRSSQTEDSAPTTALLLCVPSIATTHSMIECVRRQLFHHCSLRDRLSNSAPSPYNPSTGEDHDRGPDRHQRPLERPPVLARQQQRSAVQRDGPQAPFGAILLQRQELRGARLVWEVGERSCLIHSFRSEWGESELMLHAESARLAGWGTS